MNPVSVLGSEHDALEMELSELKFIISVSEEGEEINYPNLVHTFWKTCGLWQTHEKMEEDIFRVMEKEGFVIPIETIFLEHKKLRGHIKRINDAINSGNDAKVRNALIDNMKSFVEVLRKHVCDEEEILAGVIVSNFSREGVKEIRNVVGKYK